jgi:hypothetical protein
VIYLELDDLLHAAFSGELDDVEAIATRLESATADWR